MASTTTTEDQHHYKFNVTMTCGGCSGAVERVLKKLDGRRILSTCLFTLLYPTQSSLRSRTQLTLAGVKSYNVSLETQTADIFTEASLPYATVLEKIKKTGKTVNSGEADGEGMAVA